MLRIAPYNEFNRIFFTSWRLSQNAISSLVVLSLFFFCITLRSAYHRSNNPGMMPSFSYEKMVPFALNAQLLAGLNTISYNSDAICFDVLPSSQSTSISISDLLSITSEYSNELNNPSHAPANVTCVSPFRLVILSLIYLSVLVGLNCPIIVSGAMFNDRIIDGYRLLISIDPIHL